MNAHVRARGVTLIELMVAITIGAILIFGATQVYVDSRAAYEVNETSARLQETARYAFGVIETDVRMANYWGLVKGANVIIGQGKQSESAVFTGTANVCGTNFIADLLTNVEGANNQFALGPDRDTSNCAPFGTNGAVVTADTLTIRRASTATAASTTGIAHICSTRVNGLLHADTTACTASPAGQGNNLIVDSYYVSRDSDATAGVPSLRRKYLITGPTFDDQEIISGVEDMQVQFGIDPTGTNGTTATRYVNPGTALPATAQVVSVRVWLLVRADTPELGFKDNKTYVYGDRAAAQTTADLNSSTNAGKAFKPSLATDSGLTSLMHYRRLLVSRTFQLRNAMGT